MERPQEKYWKATSQEIGREVRTPDYIQWADSTIKALLEACEALIEWIKTTPMPTENPYGKGGCIEKALQAISLARGEEG